MKTSINALHHQGNDWLREIAFYKDELTLLTQRLEDVARHNTGHEVLPRVEHFQNKFIMLREQLDTLKHDINQRNEAVDTLAKDRPEHIGEKYTVVSDKVQERVKDYARSIADTRYEFNTFLARTL